MYIDLLDAWTVGLGFDSRVWTEVGDPTIGSLLVTLIRVNALDRLTQLC